MLGRNWLLAASAILWAATGWCGEAGSNPPDASTLRNWVTQLNDDDYAVREEAARQLTEAGAAAIAELVEGLASDQAEVSWRCGAALEEIGLEGDDATVEQIVKHLDAACAKTERPGLKSLATELHERQKQFRRERAVAKIRKNGGRVASSAMDGGAAAEFDEGFFPFAGPAIIFDGPVVEMEAAAIPVPAAEIEPELPRGEVFDLFAEIGRVIGRAVAPGGLAPPADPEPKPEEPKAEAAAKDAAEVATDLGDAVEEAKKAIEEATKAAEDAVKAAEAPPLEGSEPAPLEEVKVIEAAAAEAAVEVMAVGVGFAEVAVDEGIETGNWAQLGLDANWRGGDEGLAVLKDLPELKQIDIQQAKLTDKALQHFAQLPNLKQLNLHHAGFSRDALLKFHRQRPGVVIYSRGDAMMGIHGDLNTSPLVLTTVQDGSGAAQAGLQAGDIVHQIDHVKIRDFSDLTICVTARKPGDKIEVEYEREGKKRTVEVTLTLRTD